MTEVGTVAQLWRYPVKSFQGEPVDELTIGPGGAGGDRILAVVDPAAKKVLSAKRYADLLLASARLDGDRVVLTLPDGAEHASDDPGVHDALSAWLDKDVRLEPPPADEAYPMEMYTGMSDEDTPLFDWTGPARHLGRPGRLPLGHHREPGDDRRRAPGRRSGTSAASARTGSSRPPPTGYPEEGWPTFELGEAAGGGAHAHDAVLDAVAGPAGARARQGHRHHDPGREQQQPGRLRPGDQERNGQGGR